MSFPLGLHASFTRTMPLPERLDLVRSAGFDATSLWWEEQRPEIRAIRHRAPDLVRRAGLQLDHLHVPYFACNDLWSDDPAERDAAIDLHRGWVDDCARHGVPRMVMHVTRGKSVPMPSESALDAFSRLVGHAEDRLVTIAIENTHLPSHLELLFESIVSPCLALCYDIAHDRLHSDRPLDLLRRRADRLAVLHVSDTDGRRDWHWLPGEGNTDFGEVGTCLGAAAAESALVLEGMMRRGDDDVQGFVFRAAESARRVRDALAFSASSAEQRLS